MPYRPLIRTAGRFTYSLEATLIWRAHAWWCVLQDSICLDHEVPGSYGQHLLVCTASQQHGLLAFSSSGSPNRLKIVDATAQSNKPLILQQEHIACSCAYSSAAFSADGSYLAALCGPAQPYIEYWQLSPLQLLHSAELQPGHTGIQQSCEQSWPHPVLVHA